LPPRWTAAVAVGALGVSAAQFAIRPATPGDGKNPAGAGFFAAGAGFLSAYLVFAVLPLLAGRYVAQQRELADRERLRERLAIARDMHDRLGRRLSLAAVQAAALEVSDLSALSAPQRAAVVRLATAIRASVTELHEVLGVLRDERARGMSAVSDLIEEFRAAGVAVSARSGGTPVQLRPHADEAAYRVIEEGLTNAARHAPGRPVSVTVAWQAGTLLLTVVNAADPREHGVGSGLADLAGRLRDVGGVLGHEMSGGQFRLHAALPSGSRRPGSRVSAVGLAVGALLLVILPTTVLLGVG
jgi:signal transduction histidine kinase